MKFNELERAYLCSVVARGPFVGLDFAVKESLLRKLSGAPDRAGEILRVQEVLRAAFAKAWEIGLVVQVDVENIPMSASGIRIDVDKTFGAYISVVD